MLTNTERVKVLSDVTILQKFSSRIIVIKYGGAAMKNQKLKDHVISDLVFLSFIGLRPILVHGGGPEINFWLDQLKILPKFENGVRVTDQPTMDIVEMVLVGRVNKDLVASINKQGGKSVGLSGKDGLLITSRPSDKPNLGFVGEVQNVDTNLLEILINNNYIPVIASVAADKQGQSYNINADTVAGEIAARLNAEKLILLTDTPGILRNASDATTLISHLSIQEARDLTKTAVISGGMIPKVNCCIRSLAQGVASAHILDGRIDHALLLEILTDQGIGSMLVV
uniref:Acetylglutamate kinase n=2 Tax=Porphyra TaxID=2784 RepID=ARGB_PORUM|nr:acetylglutamate kinase [Porphyra purpurea]P69365.1 RecName: Full=Acetylglutamate kinase; AltName: Full=N-acetyl-L-glutamate 5-phosphotransferase; AltName: Full=NAG kinase; Short=NAGK [Porphyra purpurea]P69366.1 RecName: Full=Acetylglutamate kinase; AltName: Full=N-acetyl-L-glutamate 5-phosphotransferase; AltName: Full=NAG kinase; Short=NAGK [Porphyra umbilicalis]AAA03053.1 N-acetylglutamate kinase [Porphyra umbilicalis]AAC08214.1 acetylglutamate kinase [Porphyra purpurea]